MAILTALSAPAFSEGPYKIPWQTIDSGGGTGSGGSFTLTSTIGQPDTDWGSGGDYEVLGGFWPGGPLCIVDLNDFAKFASLWLSYDPTGDFDGDGEVNYGDLATFATYWLCDCPNDWPLK